MYNFGMATNATQPVAAAKIHKFESAGLGLAPYRYVGCERTVVVLGIGPDASTRPGATCDFCGTAISTSFYLVSADERRFKVGCDCIAKAGDEGLVRKIAADVRKMESDKRAARDAKRNATALARAAELFANPEVCAKLAAMPHPQAWRAEKGETMLDSMKWLIDHAGTQTRVNTIKAIERLIA